jgi:arsenical pump membrane protein
MLACGLVSVSQSVQTVLEGANVLFFLLALMVLSALLDLAGFFEWAAILAGRACEGDGERLYRNVFLLGAATTAVLSLDTTAIILTPIVVALVQRLNLKAHPFLIACAFVANTGSLLFPVSNLTNLLFQEAFRYSFVSFTLFMLIPQLVALMANYWLFKLLFKSSIPKTFDKNLLPPALSVVPDRPFFIGALMVVILVIFGYFAASVYRIHPVIVASIGAGVLLAWGAFRHQLNSRLWKDISWSLFPFVIGLFVVIRAVENIGLSKSAAGMIGLADRHELVQVPAIACAAALGSNLINNIPMALLAVSALKSAHSSLLDQYAALIGCNLGPNLTIAGSLATMLVITSARTRGQEISAMDFMRVGLVTTPVLILGTSLAVRLVGYMHL